MPSDLNMSTLYQQHLQTVMARTSEILAASPYDYLVIPSGCLKYPFKDDMPYPFKPSPYFLHYLPLTKVPECYLVLSESQKPRLCFYQPKDFWHKVAEAPDDFWTEYFDIQVFSQLDELDHLLPRHEAAYIGETSDQSQNGSFAAINPAQIINPLNYYRAKKTPYEQYCLTQANHAALLGHAAVKKTYYDDSATSTFALHMAYLASSQHLETELPYQNIIGLNEDAAILHNTALNPTLLPSSQKHSLLIDAGASFHGYGADITRSYAYDIDSEFAELIAAMDALQQSIAQELKIGDSWIDTNQKTHYRLAELLAAFQLVNLPAETIVTDGISQAFLPHGLGHLLGIQVHDIGGKQTSAAGEITPSPEQYPSLRCTKVLEENHVLTVEPGLYFIDMLLEPYQDNKHFDWQRINHLKQYGGIRIEDNVVIEKNGIRNITRECEQALVGPLGLEPRTNGL